jgi:hypothetical protein
LSVDIKTIIERCRAEAYGRAAPRTYQSGVDCRSESGFHRQVDRLRGPPDVLQYAGERGEVAGVAAQRPDDCTFEASLS